MPAHYCIDLLHAIRLMLVIFSRKMSKMDVLCQEIRQPHGHENYAGRSIVRAQQSLLQDQLQQRSDHAGQAPVPATPLVSVTSKAASDPDYTADENYAGTSYRLVTRIYGIVRDDADNVTIGRKHDPLDGKSSAHPDHINSIAPHLIGNRFRHDAIARAQRWLHAVFVNNINQ